MVRGISCDHSDSCECARCEIDGPLEVILGNFRTHAILGRRTGAELYMAFTHRPRRGPILLEYRGTDLVPVDRGDRRKEVLDLIQPLLAGVSERGRSGRPAGTGLSAGAARAAVDDEVRAGARTITDAINLAADKLGYSAETVRKRYYG